MAQQQGTQSGTTGTRAVETRGGASRGAETGGEMIQRGMGRGMLRREPWSNWLSSGIAGGSPFSMMRRFIEDMDRMVENYGMGSSLASRIMGSEGMLAGGAAWMPAIELIERDNDIVLCAELPGCKKEDIHVRIDNGMLIVEGERRHSHEEKGEGTYHSERSYGRFQRAISLAQDIDENKVKANFKDGILEVVLPRSGVTRGRQIEIGEESAGPVKH